ncbi:MAG: hemerythrin domain-containing protein [Marinifilaceae bacterium]|nr:hemerythrin domain-containing protein [Marinifilaceae bacterium]
MKQNIFSRDMKLAEVVCSNRNTILILPRFGIELGFGEKSVEDVCNEYGIDTSLFMIICNLYSSPNYMPTKYEIENLDIDSLLSYLRASHKYYLNSRIPHIEHHLNRLAEAMPEKDGRLLKNFYKGYCNEVINHFEYEEQQLFPYVQGLLKGVKSDNFSIEIFENNHTNIEDKLSDLKSIIIKYLPGGIMQEERISILFDLFRLAEDIDRHTLIEDKILAPYVQLLENR